MSPIVRKIVEAFEQRGSERYGVEPVTQLQHALQSGQLAKDSGARDQLVAAALLHDIGHLLGDDAMPADAASNLDDKHESRGHAFLLKHFGEAVADPVRLHVVAKRYLCTRQPEYEAKLSPTSRKSFHDQGGMMSAEEIEAFEAETFYRDALQLRYWDDTAKDPAAATAELREFLPQLNGSLKLSG